MFKLHVPICTWFIAVDELYMALVTSTKAHARITSVDSSASLACTGVKDFISVTDVAGSNIYRHTHDELVFADSEVL